MLKYFVSTYKTQIHNSKTQIANQYFLLWSLYLSYLIPVQCPNSPNKSWIYWLFTVFCFKYNNDWLRIHKFYQCKQFRMILVHTCYYMSNLHNLLGGDHRIDVLVTSRDIKQTENRQTIEKEKDTCFCEESHW